MANRRELTVLGVLPPHDELPVLTAGLNLSVAQRAQIDMIRARYRQRFEPLWARVLGGQSSGPDTHFTIRRLEEEERRDARAVLRPDQHQAFDAAVTAMLAKRQSMIRVTSG